MDVGRTKGIASHGNQHLSYRAIIRNRAEGGFDRAKSDSLFQNQTDDQVGGVRRPYRDQPSKESLEICGLDLALVYGASVRPTEASFISMQSYNVTAGSTSAELRIALRASLMVRIR